MEKQKMSQDEPGGVITEVREELVEIEENDGERVEMARRTLLGKVLARKIVNKGAVRAICVSAWGEAAEVKVSDMGPNIFMFTFPSEEATKRVMLKSPWSVMNYMLSLQQWDPDIAVTEVDFNKIPIWVQIHGLPFGAMTVINAGKIMKIVGDIMEVENPMVDGVLLRSFMRVRINFDIQKPLPTGCWVPRKNMPKSWIMFRYEKLQGFCYSCGVIGHEQKDCRKTPVMTAICKEIQLYGANLSAPPAKAINLLIKEQQRGRKEAESSTDQDSKGKQAEEAKDTGKESHGGSNRKEGAVEMEGEEMGQEQVQQRRGEQSSQSKGKAIDPTLAMSFIRQQQREEWEALKAQMGQVIITPWYRIEPGSHLPPKKVFRLQGTKGYNIENVVCMGSESEGQRAKEKIERDRAAGQKEVVIERHEGDGEEVTYEKDKGIRGMGVQANMEREKELEEMLLIKKCMEGVRPNEGLTNPHSLTLVDKECDMPRAGLGPEQTEELGLQEEDIGLKKPVILKDYISPPRVCNGPTVVGLSPGSIKKCRSACLKLQTTGQHQAGSQVTKDKIVHDNCKECKWIKTRISYREKEKQIEDVSPEEKDYRVEFPPDEDEKEGAMVSCIRQEDERLLVVEVQKSLSIKRNRLCIEGARNVAREQGEEHIKKRKQGNELLGSYHGLEDNKVLNDTIMAEEAGLSMPPPPP